MEIVKASQPGSACFSQLQNVGSVGHHFHGLDPASTRSTLYKIATKHLLSQVEVLPILVGLNIQCMVNGFHPRSVLANSISVALLSR